jgi:alcohol dehydrogenase
VAFGGGSALDVGKLIAFMAGQTRPMWDFEDIGDWWTARRPEGHRADRCAVPTTAAPARRSAAPRSITDEATHTKKIIFHPLMMPKVTICDPELTVGMPPIITAGTGMDALRPLPRGLLRPFYHPLADGVAVEGMRLVKETSPRRVTDGHDLEARAHMMAAAAMGATAFQKALGAIHALSHPVGVALRHPSRADQRGVHAYVLVFNRSRSRTRSSASRPISGSSRFPRFHGFRLKLREETGGPHTLAGLKGRRRPPSRWIVDMAARLGSGPPAGNPVPFDKRRLGAHDLQSRAGGPVLTSLRRD